MADKRLGTAASNYQEEVEPTNTRRHLRNGYQIDNFQILASLAAAMSLLIPLSY